MTDAETTAEDATDESAPDAPETATIRDRVWSSAFDCLDAEGRVTVAGVLDAAGLTERQRDTARNVLNAMTELGHLDHAAGSPVWTRPVAEQAQDAPALTVLRDRNATKWTFADPEIRRWVEDRLQGRVLNLFAGRTHLDHDGEVVRNDVNAARDADHHIDAMAVADHFPADAFDTVLMDPPWGEGVTKRRSLYGGEFVDDYSVVKDGVAEVVRPGGRVILFGYDSSGLGAGRGFHVEEVAAIHFTGNHRDVLATVEAARF